MATTFSKALQPSNSTNANMRGWVGFIDSTLIAGGWVNTTDTGQTAVASFVTPSSGNTAAGYRVYRMNDALQASAPVFLRLDFGSSYTPIYMGLWITLGPSTNGAGVVDRPFFESLASNSATISANGVSDTLALPYSFGSADSSRVAVALACDEATNSGPYLLFCIERTYGADGLPNGDGVLLLYGDSGQNINRYFYLSYLAAPQPPVEQANARVETEYATSATSDRVGVSVLFPWYLGLPRQPGTNVLIGRRGDWTESARINVEFYGAQHVYQALFAAKINAGGNTLVLMRYE